MMIPNEIEFTHAQIMELLTVYLNEHQFQGWVKVIDVKATSANSIVTLRATLEEMFEDERPTKDAAGKVDWDSYEHKL